MQFLYRIARVDEGQVWVAAVQQSAAIVAAVVLLLATPRTANAGEQLPDAKKPNVSRLADNTSAGCGGIAANAGGMLAMIPKCQIVYCAAGTDPKMKENLRFVDDRLGELQTLTMEVNASWQKFLRACRGLGGDFQQTGPLMDTFRAASFEMGTNKQKLTKVYDKIQRYPEEDVFNATSRAMIKIYRQPACMNQINQLVVNSLNAAQDMLQKAQIDCSPAQ